MRGKVVYQFAFDVASEIQTPRIREVLSEKPSAFEIRADAALPRDVRFYRPLAIALKPEETGSALGRIVVKPFVKVFDIGVLSITFEIPFDRAGIGDLVAYHRVEPDGKPLRDRASDLCRAVAENLKPYLVRPTPPSERPEAYTVFCIENLEDGAGPLDAWVGTHGRELASLLCEERNPDSLSVGQARESLRLALSYTSRDWTVVDWDAAVVADLSGYFDDVLYVMELANVQLEEYRLLDDRLDALMMSAYGDLERYYSRRRLWGSPDRILGTLRSFRLDITKMSEAVTNITKFVGDWYLARLYMACAERFHLAHWERSVDDKVRQLDEMYRMVHGEITNRRMLVLEALIVALFLLDLAALLWWK